MDYPATLELDAQLEVARWRPILAGILAIPHLIVLYVLQIAASVAVVVAWFAIVFTGKLPKGLGDFVAMMLRYSTRVTTYAGFLYEPYPPFDFTSSAAEPGGSPVRVNYQVAYEDRNRLTVLFRLILAIPAAIFFSILGFVVFLALFVAFFAVIVTGAWPQGLRDFVVGFLRANNRFNAYAYLLTDEYPPFATS